MKNLLAVLALVSCSACAQYEYYTPAQVQPVAMATPMESDHAHAAVRRMVRQREYTIQMASSYPGHCARQYLPIIEGYTRETNGFLSQAMQYNDRNSAISVARYANGMTQRYVEIGDNIVHCGRQAYR